MDVEFNRVNIHFKSLAETFERVFGCMSRGAAVADFDHPTQSFNSRSKKLYGVSMTNLPLLTIPVRPEYASRKTVLFLNSVAIWISFRPAGKSIPMIT